MDLEVPEAVQKALVRTNSQFGRRREAGRKAPIREHDARAGHRIGCELDRVGRGEGARDGDVQGRRGDLVAVVRDRRLELVHTERVRHERERAALAARASAERRREVSPGDVRREIAVFLVGRRRGDGDE